MSAEIREINVTTNAQRSGEAELIEYLLWSMKHDVDPHELHDDPIIVFRKEMLGSEKRSNKNVA